MYFVYLFINFDALTKTALGCSHSEQVPLLGAWWRLRLDRSNQSIQAYTLFFYSKYKVIMLDEVKAIITSFWKPLARNNLPFEIKLRLYVT